MVLQVLLETLVQLAVRDCLETRGRPALPVSQVHAGHRVVLDQWVELATQAHQGGWDHLAALACLDWSAALE